MKFFNAGSTMALTTLPYRRLRWLKIFVLLFSIGVMFFPSIKAHAATCTGAGGTVPIAMPSAIAVPRDTPVGTILNGGSWVTTAAVTNWYTCNTAASEFHAMAFSPGSMQKSGVTVASGGVTYTAWNTTVPGVGLIVAVKSNANGCGWQGWFDLGTQTSYSMRVPAPWVTGSCNAMGIPDGGQVSVALVKTGNITPGTVTGGSLVEGAEFLSGAMTPAGHVYYSLSSTKITVLACTTPDVVVPLGPHARTELTGLNTFTSSTSFSVSLNGCPAGMNSIQYRIDPVTTVVNSANSVVALDSSSTATGVGVQLLDGTGVAFKLSTQTTFSGYSASTGGSYTIPFKARYYETGSSVSAGTANASMTFTMTYL